MPGGSTAQTSLGVAEVCCSEARILQKHHRLCGVAGGRQKANKNRTSAPAEWLETTKWLKTTKWLETTKSGWRPPSPSQPLSHCQTNP
jgi:hypothetical protein